MEQLKSFLLQYPLSTCTKSLAVNVKKTLGRAFAKVRQGSNLDDHFGRMK